jgi:hypothetical protein
MSSPTGVRAPSGVRPSVDDVAVIVHSRTKDPSGNEIGTFDDVTRPTADTVEKMIDQELSLVLMRLPPIEYLRAELVPAIAATVALGAACRVEKSLWPEQVLSDRSPYAQLLAEYLDARQALITRAEETAAGLGRVGIGSIPVRSWTTMPAWTPPS